MLYPRGRAFKMPVGGVLEKVHAALAKTEAQVYADAHSILNSVLPDNDNFTTADATDWERRLGIFSSDAVPLADRKLAILRKMNHPGTIRARQHYLYLQEQLRAAGFDVYVHENRFDDGVGGYITKTPEQVAGSAPTGYAVHGIWRHDQIQHGAQWSNKIVNHVDEALDAVFVVSPNYRSTFFISGDESNPGVFASVLAARKNEFRQLILQLKPAQTVGFLFVNYTA